MKIISPTIRLAIVVRLIAIGLAVLASVESASAQLVWQQRQSNISSSLTSVTFGNGLFVAGARSGGIVTSPDAVTWTYRATPSSDQVLSLTYGNNLFVAGINNATYPYMTSSNGTTWTLRSVQDPNGSNTTSVAHYGVAYGNAKYVGVGTYLNSVATSSNGTSWRTANGANSVPGFPGNAHGLTFGNGYFFACHSQGKVSRSTNGLSWTVPAASGVDETMWGIAYGRGTVVAVGANRIFTSTNGGNSFVAINNPTPPGNPTAYFFAVAFGNNTFVAVGKGGVIYSSADGLNWTWRGNYANGYFLNGVGYGGNRFVAVGDKVDQPTAYLYSSGAPVKADFNGDGKPDILLQNNNTGQRYIWLMAGTQVTGGVSLGYVSTEWDIVGTADFTGDGWPDILLQNRNTGQRYLWLLTGTQITGSVDLGYVSTEWDIVGAADFTGDGWPDILWQNRNTGQRYLWPMTGTQHTGNIDLGYVSTEWDIVGTGDFTGDGWPDILWQNRNTGQRYLWPMTGTQHTGNVDLGNVPTAWDIVGVGDFTGEGQVDILWQNHDTGQRYFWLMTGAQHTGNADLGYLSTEWNIRNR